jgi:hypothetical protein
MRTLDIHKAGHRMHKGNAYAVLSEEMAKFSRTPLADLMALIGKPATRKDVNVAGEILSVELVVAWADQTHRSLRLEAIANGPSHWHLERLVEHFVIPVAGVR